MSVTETVTVQERPMNFKNGSKNKKKKTPRVNHGKYGDLIRLPPLYLNLSNQVFRAKRTVAGTVDISQLAGTDTLFAYLFKLNDLQDSSEFTALFDMYMFEYVEVVFRPVFNFQTVSTISSIVTGDLITVIDYDDAATATISALMEYETVRISNFDKQQTRRLRPRIAIAAYGSSSFASYGNFSPQWIDTASTTVEHYGVKGAIFKGAVGQTALQSFSVQLIYYMAFKNVK